MDGGMTTMVCTVAATLRCETATDGPHSRVAYTGGRWWRWLPMGAWVLSARAATKPAHRHPTLIELAASVPRADRAQALAAIGVTT